MSERANGVGGRQGGHPRGRGGGGNHNGGHAMEPTVQRMGAVSIQDHPYQQVDNDGLPETLVSFDNALRITKRPDEGGKRGTPIALEANHFRFKLEGQVVVQQYDVTLNRYDTSGKIRKATLDENHILFWYAVKRNEAIFGSPDQMVYDRKKQMYSLKMIDECRNKMTVKLRETSVLVRDNNKQYYFTLEVKHVSAITVNDVRQAYNENLNERERQQIQFLELLFRQGRYFNDHLIPAGRSFYMRAHKNDSLDLGCGRELLRGFYLSTRLIDNWQLSLNVDWNVTAFYEPEHLIEFAAKFLTAYYKQRYNPHDEKPPNLTDDYRRLLERELKDVKFITDHTNETFKPAVFAAATARTQQFHWEDRDIDHGMVTIEEYFKRRYNRQLRYPGWPLLQRGKGQNVRYTPMEVCTIAPGQRVKNKDITDDQHKTMVLQTAVTPFQRRLNILNMLKEAKLAADPRLRQFYISMSMEMAKVSGRVIPPPQLQYTGGTVQPQGGQWNGGTLYKGAKLSNWGFVVFSRDRDDEVRHFGQLLYQEGRKMGMDMDPPYMDEIYRVGRPRPGEEQEQTRDALQAIKVAFDQVQMPLQLIIVVLDKKQRDGPYNEIKRYSEQHLGVMTQCVLHDRVFNVSPNSRDKGRKGQQALSNIILKINAKMGGVNVQISKTDPIANKFLFQPVLFIGADVTHPDKGEKRSPSIAAVCGNIDNHPNKYMGIELVQPSGVEIISKLKQAVKELLKAYYVNTGGLKPDKIIFYRDGVSEGQFLQVLQVEEKAIETACMELEESYRPAITFIVVQKRHHTRFFKQNINQNDKATAQNIPPGTVVDRGVTHPVEFDFFLCSHQGIQGTSKPTHYHVLFDQTGFSSDQLQALTYQLCHTYARCTRSVSIPAPCYYAHHIAYRAKIRSKGALLNGYSSGSSSSGSDGDRLTEEELLQLQMDIELKENLKKTMYWQ